MKSIRKAIIPAAGLGTRFLPATKAQPKEMLPIVDKPTIQYIIEEAVASGIEDIIIVTGRNKRAIEDHFDRSVELEDTLAERGDDDLLQLVTNISNMADIHYIRQKEPKGLGHAIWCARKFIGNEPFAVLLGDDVVVAEKPCLRQMIEVYDVTKASVIGVKAVSPFEVSQYGIVAVNNYKTNLHRITNLVEKPCPEHAPSNLAIMGRYIIQPEIFDILESQSPGAGGEIQLTDALRTLNEVKSMYAYEFDGRRYDVGNKQGYLQATVEFALARPDLREQFLEYLRQVIQQEEELECLL